MNLDEKQFVHDLASPLATALLLTESLKDRLISAQDLAERETWIEHLKIVVAALERCRLQVENRRAVILSGKIA
jgi:hypothetical protein